MLTLGTAAINWVYHTSVSNRLTRLQQTERIRVLTTEWISDGDKRTWTSTWKEHDDSESFGEFLKRHATEVKDAKEVFPKDKSA